MDAEIKQIISLLTRIAVAMEASLKLGPTSEPEPERLKRIEALLQQTPTPRSPPQPTSELMSIDEFMKELGMSRATYYRMVERDIPLFPKQVYPGGPGTHMARLLRSEVKVYLDSLTRIRDGKRRVGRPRKN